MSRLNPCTMNIERRVTGGKSTGRPMIGRTRKSDSFRDWWLVNGSGVISLPTIKFPKSFIGKHINFKVIVKEFPKNNEK